MPTTTLVRLLRLPKSDEDEADKPQDGILDFRQQDEHPFCHDKGGYCYKFTPDCNTCESKHPLPDKIARTRPAS